MTLAGSRILSRSAIGPARQSMAWEHRASLTPGAQIFTRLGKCYTFNAGAPGNELLTTVKGGSGNGLELMLNIQQEEYLPVWGESDEISYEAGVKVQIHSQEEPPFIDQLGFGVAPGFQTFVSCQQQRVSILPSVCPSPGPAHHPSARGAGSLGGRGPW